jgi:hypothetical protein
MLVLQRYYDDLRGNGLELLEHVLCSGCADQFGLTPGSPISDEIWASDERFPYVCPICEKCLTEWIDARGLGASFQ